MLLWDSDLRAEIRRNTLKAETPYFETFRDGLVSKLCKVLLEDNEGYIWIGTRNGVARYDGITMVNVFSAYGSTKFDYDVWAMCEDTICDCIWVSFGDIRKPLVRIDKRTFERQEIYTDLDNTHEKAKNQTVMNSIVTYNDTLLLGCDYENGFYIINKQTGSVYAKNTFVEKYLSGKVVKLKDDIYIISNDQLYRVIGRDPYEIEVEFLYSGHVRNLSYVNDSTFAFMIPEQVPIGARKIQHVVIYEMNKNTHHCEFVCRKMCGTLDGYTHPFPTDFVCADDGYWITNQYGISFFRRSDGKILEFSSQNSQLIDNNIYTCIKSRHQPIYWFGTEDGLVKNDYYAAKFNLIDLAQSSESVRNKAYMIHKDYYNNCWIWCLDGLFCREYGDAKFRAVTLNGKFEKESILTALEDTVNHYLYFHSTKHLLRYNQITKKCDYIFEAQNVHESQKANYVPKEGKIISDKTNFSSAKMREDGVIIVTTGRLICMYNPATKKYDIKNIDNILNDYTIKNFDVDGDSVLWIINSIGQLFSYKYENNSAVCQNLDSIKANRINTIWRNGQREIWISTLLKGFYYYLPDKHKFNRINYSRYLIGEIPTFEIDKNKNVWIGTNEGIVCINNTNGSVTEFSREKYSICQEFNRNASTVAYNGDIIMGGLKYIVEFNTSEVEQNDYFPAPLIASYEFLNSTTYSFDSYTSNIYYNVKDTIVIPQGIRSIRLTVRMMNYSSSSKNYFQWRIPDRDKEWHQSSIVSPLIFDLPMGIHCLELRSCDNSNNPTDNVSCFWFDKKVYFYENPHFHILMIILAIIIVIMVIRTRSRIALKRRLLLQAEVERQAGDIRRANERLQKSQNLIEIQNLQLQQSRVNLEKQIEDRTCELEAAMKRAEENSKLKSAFLANLSHEVRTPMNCIVGFSKLLGDPSCTKQERDEFVHLIQESSAGLLVLIGDLLDVSRIESGQLRVNRREFNIFNEINDVYRILFIEKKNPSVDFLLDVDPRLENMMIYSDKDRVRQIFINITYNAFKFTENGQVQINAKLATIDDILNADYPQSFPNPPIDVPLFFASIEDTGIGIPADKLDVIFDPFRKLNNNKTLYPGLGLGLNIVKNLVQLLDGQIWVCSEVGRGTKFYFYLPFTNPPENQ